MPSRPVPPDALRPTPAGRRRRTALKGGRRSAAGAPTTLLLRDEDDPLRLSGRSGRTWERVLARILGPSLDRQLAAGCPPEGNGLLATRAQTLVSPQSRRALAGNWEHLLAVIRPGPEGRRVHPLCRDRVAAAEPAVRLMIDALVAAVPVPARGVALAGQLLRDGAGPVYNRRSPVGLEAALQEVIAQLSPWVPLTL